MTTSSWLSILDSLQYRTVSCCYDEMNKTVLVWSLDILKVKEECLHVKNLPTIFE